MLTRLLRSTTKRDNNHLVGFAVTKKDNGCHYENELTVGLGIGKC